MRTGNVLLALAFAVAGCADTLTLRSGRVVEGTYLGGTARQVRMEVADKVETFDIGDVKSLQFAAPVSAPPAAPVSAPAPAAEEQRPRLQRHEDAVLRPEPAPAPAPAAAVSELPAGTNFVVRMIDAV